MWDLPSFKILFELASAVPIQSDSKMMGQFENIGIGRLCPLLVVVSCTPIPLASLPWCIHVTTHPTNKRPHKHLTSQPTMTLLSL